MKIALFELPASYQDKSTEEGNVVCIDYVSLRRTHRKEIGNKKNSICL